MSCIEFFDAIYTTLIDYVYRSAADQMNTKFNGNVVAFTLFKWIEESDR